MSEEKRFREIALISDPETGVIATIQVRDRNGQPRLSFAFMKEFDRDGRVERSAFLEKRHVAAVRRLMDQLDERLEVEEDRLRAGAREEKRKATP